MTPMYIINPYILGVGGHQQSLSIAGIYIWPPKESHLQAPWVHNAHSVPFLNKHLQCGMPRPRSIRPIRDSKATEPVFRPASHIALNRLVCPYYIALSLTFQPPMVPTFQHSKDAEVTTTFPTPWHQYLERLTPKASSSKQSIHGPRFLSPQSHNCVPMPAEEAAAEREGSSLI